MGLHFCEPDRYPTSLPDAWTCPECGRDFAGFSTRDDALMYGLSDVVRRHLKEDSLGWKVVE